MNVNISISIYMYIQTQCLVMTLTLKSEHGTETFMSLGSTEFFLLVPKANDGNSFMAMIS